jgi:enolase-phosphatase E1
LSRPALYPAADGSQISDVQLSGEASIRVILLDIEGTTTPIDFVTTVLFPYASRKIESFIMENFQNEQVHTLIVELREQLQEDAKRGLQPPRWKKEGREAEIQSAAAYCRWLIERDSKYTSLKALQGMIWQAGYASGELRGQVYPDVPHAFERWRRQQREIAIYSSGSVLAQRLIFQTTPFGDLTGFIRDYFDTHAGAKTDPVSYRKIADALGRSSGEILFISDALKEVEAAKAAGMQSELCDRSAQFDADKTGAITSFDAIFAD